MNPETKSTSTAETTVAARKDHEEFSTKQLKFFSSTVIRTGGWLIQKLLIVITLLLTVHSMEIPFKILQVTQFERIP